MDRPRGVTIIAIFYNVQAVFCVLFGIIVLFGTSDSLDGLEISFLISGALAALLASSLRRLRNWARVVAIALSLFGIFSSLRGFLTGDAERLSTLKFSLTIFQLVVDALIVSYLLTPNANAAFHRDHTDQPPEINLLH